MRETVFICILSFILKFGIINAQHDQKIDNKAYPLSVLITEVFFDPEPSVGLPSHEYVEIYNYSKDTINLENWVLKVGNKSSVLSGYVLFPGEYLVLIGPSAFQAFNLLDIPILNIKWNSLRNSGQDLILVSSGGDIVHFMSYHPMQIGDALKREGGWSLELADMDNACHQEAWITSINPLGGSPGSRNSVNIDTGNIDPPRILRAGILGNRELLIHLDKPILPLLEDDWFLFSFSNPFIFVDSWNYYEDSPEVIRVVLQQNLPEKTRIYLELIGEATDCSGKRMLGGVVQLGIPEPPDSGDVVISEVMFDPKEDQSEFICIHNNSNKILEMNDMYVAVCDDDGVVLRFSKPDDQSFLMFPGREYVLTADFQSLSRFCHDSLAGQICERGNFISLSNQGSNLCLFDSKQKMLDKIRYKPDWHDPRLSDTKGISLERISLTTSAYHSSNWHSASSFEGGSTPGRLNSQRKIFTNDDGVFYLDNPVFSPNGDGYEDFLLVRVSTEESGWIANASIWNMRGELVKDISLPGVLPSNGFIKWDGNDEFGRRVSSNFYIIIINFIRPDGSKGRWKDGCGVTAY